MSMPVKRDPAFYKGCQSDQWERWIGSTSPFTFDRARAALDCSGKEDKRHILTLYHGSCRLSGRKYNRNNFSLIFSKSSDSVSTVRSKQCFTF